MKKHIIAFGMIFALSTSTAFADCKVNVAVDPDNRIVSVNGNFDSNGKISLTVFNNLFTDGSGESAEDFDSDYAKFLGVNDLEKSDYVDMVKQLSTDDGSFDISYKSYGTKGRYAVKAVNEDGESVTKYFTLVTKDDYPALLTEFNSLTSADAVSGFIYLYRNIFFNISEYEEISQTARKFVSTELLTNISSGGYTSFETVTADFEKNVYVQKFYEAKDSDEAAKIVSAKCDILKVSELDSKYQTSNDTYKSEICGTVRTAGVKDYDGWCSEFKKAAELKNTNKNEKPSGGKGGGSVSGFKTDNSLISGQTTETAVLYNDVSNEHWAYESIYRLSMRGILAGDNIGNYRPDDSVTRAEFLKIILSTMELSDSDAQCSFEDVPVNAWYYPYVSVASKIEIVSGMGNNRFEPDAPITRQDAVKIMYNAAMFKNTILKEVKTYNEFSDEVDISSYAIPAVKMFYSAGIISGYTDGSFAPLGNVTRAEAAKMAFSFLQNGV